MPARPKISDQVLWAEFAAGLTDVEIAAAHPSLSRQAASKRRARWTRQGCPTNGLGSISDLAPIATASAPIGDQIEPYHFDPCHWQMLEGSWCFMQVAQHEGISADAMDLVHEHLDVIWETIGFDRYWGWDDDDSADPTGRIKRTGAP